MKILPDVNLLLTCLCSMTKLIRHLQRDRQAGPTLTLLRDVPPEMCASPDSHRFDAVPIMLQDSQMCLVPVD